MTNAMLAELIHRCADDYGKLHSYTDVNYDALRRLAREVAARPDPAPLRLWALPGTGFAFIPGQQGADFRFSSYCPGRGWLEIPTVRG